MPDKNLSKSYEKCANYTTLSILLMNIVKSMKRFRNIPEEKLITTIYDKIKKRANISGIV